MFTRKSLNGASFSSTQKLSEHIHAYVNSVNQNPVPFIWKKREVKGSELKNNIVNLPKLDTRQRAGWPAVTKAQFDRLVGPSGVLVLGHPEKVAKKLIRHSKALGGVDRFTFQMDNAGLTHQQLLSSIELIGTKVIPLLKGQSL